MEARDHPWVLLRIHHRVFLRDMRLRALQLRHTDGSAETAACLRQAQVLVVVGASPLMMMTKMRTLATIVRRSELVATRCHNHTPKAFRPFIVIVISLVSFISPLTYHLSAHYLFPTYLFIVIVFGPLVDVFIILLLRHRAFTHLQSSHLNKFVQIIMSFIETTRVREMDVSWVIGWPWQCWNHRRKITIHWLKYTCPNTSLKKI